MNIEWFTEFISDLQLIHVSIENDCSRFTVELIDTKYIDQEIDRTWYVRALSVSFWSILSTSRNHYNYILI